MAQNVIMEKRACSARKGEEMKNIVLIGMPGCGKSTVGVLLAKALGFEFMDTDIVIQAMYGEKLQELVNRLGVDDFLDLEEEAICDLDVMDTVIATGGSVVYGKEAMAHLRKEGIVVYLELPYAQMARRIYNLSTRGIALRAGQTLKDLYDERVPLYKANCDICFLVGDGTIEETVQRLAQLLERREGTVQ